MRRCGAPLAARCTACGAPHEPGTRFCRECGSAVGRSPPPPPPGAFPALPGAADASVGTTKSGPVAERRVCSVLFCDLVGFTSLSEPKDPEEVREILSRYFDVARQLVGRYGGTVEKFIGDAVMAVWGTPAAQEGDAERAVRAAMDLVQAVEVLGDEVFGVNGLLRLSARAGVVTGEVAVTIGAIGEGMVAGDAVNTAARVQAEAHRPAPDGTSRPLGEAVHAGARIRR